MHRAGRMPHDPRGGGAEKVIAQPRLVRAYDDAIRIYLGGIVHDGAIAVALFENRLHLRMRGQFLGHAATRHLEPGAHDLLVEIGSNGAARCLVDMQRDDLAAVVQQRTRDLEGFRRNPMVERHRDKDTFVHSVDSFCGCPPYPAGSRTILGAATRPARRSAKAVAPSDSPRASVQSRGPSRSSKIACAVSRKSCAV